MHNELVKARKSEMVTKRTQAERRRAAAALHADGPGQVMGEGGRRPGEGRSLRTLVLLGVLLCGSASAQSPTDPLNVVITAGGSLFLDGAEVDVTELAHQADLAFLSGPERKVIITADAATPHERVIEVIDLLKQHGAHRFALAVSSGPAEDIDAGPIGNPDFDAGLSPPEEEDAGAEADAGEADAGSDVAPYVEPPAPDFHKLVEATGYLDLRGSYTRSNVTGLIPTDDQPQLTATGRAERAGEGDRTRRGTFVYADVSLIRPGGVATTAAPTLTARKSSVPSSNAASAQPVASLNEVYLLHEFFPELNVLVGKKRIIWGSGQAYNPTDLLNPRKDPTDPTFQRAGAWLAQVEVPLPTITFTALFAPQVLKQLRASLPVPRVPRAGTSRTTRRTSSWRPAPTRWWATPTST